MVKSSSTETDESNKAIIIWFIVGILMLIVQILLGGITRLTGSGLSITEWKPLLGTLPPLTEEAWMQSFEKYQQIAQFKKVNSHFVLSDYKAIFFWEWFHREWARLMGLTFVIPFIVFAVKNKIKREAILPLIVLFLLGGLQGGIGWIMVKSGLNDNDVAVNHIKLALHFISAIILLIYLLWLTLYLGSGEKYLVKNKKLNYINWTILILLIIQMIYGAFMAGSHAALSAATWPDMNGRFIPVDSFASQNLLSGMFNDTLLIQFVHRTIAYLIVFFAVLWVYRASKLEENTLLFRYKWVLLILVALQVVLGISALLNSMFKNVIYYSVLHQFVGILIVIYMVVATYLNRNS